MATLEEEVAGLTTATTDLLTAVNVKKATLDDSVATASDQAVIATTKASEASVSGSTATTKAAEAVAARDEAVAVVYSGTSAIEPEAGKIPVARADGTLSPAWLPGSEMDYIGIAYNPLTQTFKRLGAAEGLPLGALANMQSSPVLANLRRVVLADDGSVYKGISWLDFTKHEDGTAVALDGTNGQIMMEYLPAYYKTDVVGDWQRMMVSHLPLPGYSLFPLFEGKDAAYRGAYEASTYLGKLCSISKSPVDGIANVYPVTTRAGDWGHASLTAPAIDALAAARGAGWRQSHLMSMTWERILMLVAFGTYNIPGVVGDGRINLSSGVWENDSYIGPLGLGDAAAGLYSAVQAGGTAGFLADYATCLGIENPWGHVWERVQSLISDGEVYHGGTDYASIVGWERLLDAEGAGITLPPASGYGGTPHSGLGLWMPEDTTGTSTAGMFDYYYYAAGVLLVGGYACSGTNAGPFYVYVRSSANTNAHFGGRLCYERTSA